MEGLLSPRPNLSSLMKNLNIFHLGENLFKEYTIQISNNIFVPEDKTKNCAVYPNRVFESYRDCDEKFLQNFVSSFDPPDLVPVWLAESFGNVTRNITMKHFGNI